MVLSSLPFMTRRRPLPMAAKMPVGPLKLSIHPGNGSFHEAPTIDGRTGQNNTRNFTNEFFPSSPIRFPPSSVPSFLPRFPHSIINLFLPSVLPSVIQSFLPSFVPSLTQSIIPSHIQSFIPSHTPSLIKSFIPILIQSFILTFNHWFTLSIIYSLFQSLIPPFNHYPTQLFHHLNMSLLTDSHGNPLGGIFFLGRLLGDKMFGDGFCVRVCVRPFTCRVEHQIIHFSVMSYALV